MAGLGQNPAQIGMPNPYGDLNGVLPNLGDLNKTASGDILSKLNGTLSPGTQSAIQNAAATYATSSGMPGSNALLGSLPSNLNLQSLGMASEAQQQQGLQDYNSFIPTVSGTQTLAPGLQNEINTQNALDAAAPNPTTVAGHAEQLFDQYLQTLRSPAGGSAPRGAQMLGLAAAGAGMPRVSGNPFDPSATAAMGGTVVGHGPAGQTSIGGQPVQDGKLPFGQNPGDWEDWLNSVSSPVGGFDWGSLGGTIQPQGGDQGTGE